MGKFQNFELNEKQRALEALKHQRRMELRAQFWKNMTDPNRHGKGEGGFMVRFSNFYFVINITSRDVCIDVMSSICHHYSFSSIFNNN